jgi:hypothetical protein
MAFSISQIAAACFAMPELFLGFRFGRGMAKSVDLMTGEEWRRG